MSWLLDWKPVWAFLQNGTMLSYAAWAGIALLVIAILFFFYDDIKDYMESSGFISFVFLLIAAIMGPIAILLLLFALVAILTGSSGSSRRR